MEESYIKGDFEKCLAQTNEKFNEIKNNFSFGKFNASIGSSYSSKQLHKCNREQSCQCNGLYKYLFPLWFRLDTFNNNKTDEVRKLIECFYSYEGSKHVPFKVLELWVQFELYRQNFEEAEYLICNYIQSSTRLSDPKS